jgi:hypothetical protein
MKPNPCLSTSDEPEQYYPFGYNNQGFIQCNGELLSVQPCPDGLYWNQEEKTCVHFDTPTSDNQLQSYGTYFNNEQQGPWSRRVSYGSAPTLFTPEQIQQMINNGQRAALGQQQPTATSRLLRPRPIEQSAPDSAYFRRSQYD